MDIDTCINFRFLDNEMSVNSYIIKLPRRHVSIKDIGGDISIIRYLYVSVVERKLVIYCTMYSILYSTRE